MSQPISNLDPKPERVWKLFDANYEKEFYDVRLKDGTIVTHCWPNAGRMNDIHDTGRSWGYGEVEISLSLTHPADD